MAAAALPPIRSVESLLHHLEAGETPKFLYFWGHTPAYRGRVGKECFSQWYPAVFTAEGDTYLTAEHYMMAEKARLFGDEITRQAILHAGHPNDAKKLGRRITPFDEAQWLAARFDIVVRGNEAKFGQHPALREFLLDTGRRVLVEASPIDAIWGIGLAQESSHAAHPEQWRGLNLLGFALMEVRNRLLNQQ
ncbi:NADAR family protein [Hymenobacter lapidiphilus]|uniref:NADAR family protein n=1 Tax=Hymenobacter sp. CCM 8763 TaxID=2303334 RepID=UPI000E3560EE|nr:NADAR family protein [Hymenobacter sp. CCM 8763]RFP63529.1 NADAR family protein [Hymenobacter sp. CCM 8763]